jgi:hypothetical protein
VTQYFARLGNSPVVFLLVPYLHRRSRAIQRKDLHLPFHRHRRRHKANRFVASLIFKLSRNREDFPIFAQ